MDFPIFSGQERFGATAHTCFPSCPQLPATHLMDCPPRVPACHSGASGSASPPAPPQPTLHHLDILVGGPSELPGQRIIVSLAVIHTWL